MAQRYCEHCGESVPPGTTYCIYCGASLSEGTMPRNNEPQPAPEHPQKNMLPYIIICVAMALIVLALAALIIKPWNLLSGSDFAVDKNTIAFAVYSVDDHSLTFYRDSEVPSSGSTYNDKIVTEAFTGIETDTYVYSESRKNSTAPWYVYSSSIITVEVASEGISPVSTSFWFYDFAYCTSMDLEKLDTSNVTDMYKMFQGCSSLSSLDLSNFDTKNVRYMHNMFAYCSSLTSLDLSNFKTDSVYDMNDMFKNCGSLRSLDLSNFDTGRVEDMSGMFSNCLSLTSLDLSSFDTRSVSNMEGMFEYCQSLTSLDLSSFDTRSVEDMERMFNYCSSLSSLDLSNFDTSSTNDMDWMFEGCTSLVVLDVSSFNTASVTDTDWMFHDCKSLTSLNLTSFNLHSAIDMTSMFEGCSSLTTIYCNDDWSTINVTWGPNIFLGCVSLKGAISYNSSKVDYIYGNPKTGYFTAK